VARAWIFQGNPKRYDLDGALRELDTIRWRVPQYTSDILPGDAVVLWRSGDDAGIVGVGRVVEPPREVDMATEELRFDRGDAGDPTTRATLRVVPCALVGKATVASLPEMSGHQIVTAPMGTVFPLDDHQWSALRKHLPGPPASLESAPNAWPAAFSWDQRTKSMNPLPGGIDAYQDVLTDIIGNVEETQPARDELQEWLAARYEVSARRAVLVVGFLGRAGLLRLESSRVHLTPDGQRWLRERDPAFLLALVHGRVRYVGELLAHLDQPRNAEELLRHANDFYGMRWTTGGQIARRRQLLGGLGAVELDEEGRLRRTGFGDALLARLDVASAQSSPQSEPSADGGDAEQPPRTVSVSVEAAAIPQHGSPDDVSAETIVQRLQDTAHSSVHPDAFERAARDAFAFLGFDAVWQGGAGRTDVLLTAPLGARRYRVVVDTKTTAHEAVGDQQIDWVTIDEHQQRYDADYASILAPAFRGDRVAERARMNRAVALLDVALLSDVVRQHEVAPLDLDTYRALFDPSKGVEDVIEQGEALRRQLVLAAEILRQVAHLEGDEGAVGAGDLYWNLAAFAEQVDGQRAEREEVEAVCNALARPPLSLLRRVGDGYGSLGSASTQSRRLRLLAALTEQGVPETAERT
jgi:hypothetical protein